MVDIALSLIGTGKESGIVRESGKEKGSGSETATGIGRGIGGSTGRGIATGIETGRKAWTGTGTEIDGPGGQCHPEAESGTAATDIMVAGKLCNVCSFRFHWTEVLLIFLIPGMARISAIEMISSKAVCLKA